MTIVKLCNGLTIFKLSPDDVEIILAKQYGDRLQPLDPPETEKTTCHSTAEFIAASNLRSRSVNKEIVIVFDLR